ncbi:MAG: peroxidase family protein, partial [Chloroflexota bacterium]
FLPLTVGEDLVDDVLDDDAGAGRRWRGNGRRRTGRRAKRGRQVYNWRNAPFIPVEFSVAAYRFGHSQVRPGYRVNARFAAPIFATPTPENLHPDDLSGGRRDPQRFVEWSNFFELGAKPRTVPAMSQQIDTILSTPLFKLPFTGPNLPGNPASLAQRNLLRHLTFALPSGQDVARAMREDPLDGADLADLAEFDLDRNTPLWFYILREAEKRAEAERLGPVGGRIVAEVFVGLLEGDRQSYLRQAPEWQPTLGPRKGRFGIVDLLKIAGVA